MYEANARTKRWRRVLEMHMRTWVDQHQPWEPLDGPLEASMTFYMPRPKRPTFPLPAVKPDVDKLCRAVLDSATKAGLIRDDARVVTLRARKRYGDTPGLQIDYMRKEGGM